jgi:hypothetical protein
LAVIWINILFTKRYKILNNRQINICSDFKQ